MNAFDVRAARTLAERSSEPGWLAERRVDALARFDALPWPDQTREEWRHTDIRDFPFDALTPLAPAHERAPTLDGVPPEVLVAIGEVGERAGLAVQVDADVVHSALAPEAAGSGVIFAPLAAAARDHPDLVQESLGAAGWPESEEKIVSLATAFAGGGTFLYVPRGVELALPLQSFRWISAPGIAVFPRVVIVADEGAVVTFIEHYAGAPLGGPAAAAGTVEIHARAGTQVSYLAVQDWPQDVWNFQIQRSIVGRDATVRSLTSTLGGAFSRQVVESVLDGAGAHSEMLGVYFADHEQRFSYWSLQDHRGPNTSSRLNFKGALKGHARAVYRGLIHIRKGADKADADQINRNLLLAEDARADPAPFLEIEANDVRCSHGTSVGQPSRDQVFYLQSRGLSPAQAERLIVKGFFQEVLDRVRVAEVRDALERAVEAELDLEE